MQLHFEVWRSKALKDTLLISNEKIVLRNRTRTRHPVYTHRRVYTPSPRFLLSYPWERREGTTRGSPVPRGLGVLSYLGRAAWWEEGGKDAGPYLRDPLLGSLSLFLPLSLPLSLSRPILSNPSACLFASSPSFFTRRQRHPRSLFLSFSLCLCCRFLHLIPPSLVVISTSSSRPRESSPLDFRKICIRVSLIMRGELASERAELSAPISRLTERSDFLVASLPFAPDLRLSMIYTGAASINKRGAHDVTLETRQWQTALSRSGRRNIARHTKFRRWSFSDFSDVIKIWYARVSFFNNNKKKKQLHNLRTRLLIF